jgi:hypothetical protein
MSNPNHSFYENDPTLNSHAFRAVAAPTAPSGTGTGSRIGSCPSGLKPIVTDEAAAAEKMQSAKTAKEVCQSAKDAGKSKMDSFFDGMAKMNVLNKLPSGAKSDTSMKNITDIGISIDQYDCFLSACELSSEVVQSNVISNKCCMDQGYTPKQCAEFNVKDVTQKNRNDSTKDCIMEQMSKIARETNLDVSTLATIEILQKTKGLFANVEENSDVCNYLRTDISADSFLQNMSACMQETNVKQSNLIECTGAQGINQSNYNRELTKCYLQAGVDLDSKVSMKIATAMHLKKDQAAEGLTLDGLFIIFLIIGLVVCVVIGAFVFLTGKGMDTPANLLHGKEAKGTDGKGTDAAVGSSKPE